MRASIFPISVALVAAALLTGSGCASPRYSDESNAASVLLPTGQAITPTAAPDSSIEALNPHLTDLPNHTASDALTERLSPDGKTLLILTSGYNLVNDASGHRIAADSSEWVFVFDVSGAQPVQKQAIPVADTCAGLAWSANGKRFFVSGGVDDSVHTYAMSKGAWTETGTPIPLGHSAGNGIGLKPVAAGVAATADGKRLLVTNLENDSLSVIDLDTRKVVADYDLRPGKENPADHGVPGGEFPYWVVVKGNDTAYVSSLRDREIDVVDISGREPRMVTRIKLAGNPNKMVLDHSQQHLYVTADNSDTVSIIDTGDNRVIDTIRTDGPLGVMHPDHSRHGPHRHDDSYYRGAVANGLALSTDESRLYVTDAGINAVAVIALDRPNPRVLGLIPTGWYPNDVAVSGNGDKLYVINGKSLAGPNPGNCKRFSGTCVGGTAYTANQYVLQLSKAGFLTMPTPNPGQLARLTRQVIVNVKSMPSAHDRRVMNALHRKIKHVIYIVRENRTYDQVLGDLDVGNGDPSLVEFGRSITPSEHALADKFVDLDNFYDSGEVSGNGWEWSTAARQTDWTVHNIPLNYAGRGTTYDSEGTNRNINMGLATVAQRQAANPATPSDPDLLPGTGNVGAPDGPDGEEQRGYLWNAALRAGLSVRNYGFFCDLSRYGHGSNAIPLDRTPYQDHLQVAFPTAPALLKRTDLYFRGFDNAFPDYYREKEWQREFTHYVADGNLPALELVRFMHDHTGNYGTAIDGVNTPETQVADNDYAVGELIDAVAHSPYRNNTLIFVVEDDSQDGPDHVDAQRSIAYVAGPYVKHHAVVSAHYTTVSMLRTIEDVLGIGHLNINDAYQKPMTDIFDLRQKKWTYTATPSPYLASTALPIPSDSFQQAALQPTHDAAWWQRRTKGMDFSVADDLDVPVYNRILWHGLLGDRPYPTVRSGKDLRNDRARLLKTAAVQMSRSTASR